MFSEDFSKKLRKNVGINGLISTLIGLLILFWPGRTAQVGTVLIGISYLVSIFALMNENPWSRFGHLLLGTVYLIAGLFSLINLAAATTTLFIIIGILVGFTWITEGFVSFGYVPYSPSKPWTILSGLLSVVAGFMLLLTPLWGAMALWTLLGVVVLVLGIFKLIRYFTW
ncbi:HdeD family acid-resistance protein [Lactococcus garvieae]|uniref:Integral membrane protein n=1 Tax=Lactococcus garvieae DCC43 TaxID=1231377 RepID=K2PPG2_9LACT|nr:DUF308 domain-containing protein [Lactococcus garvieae]EKF52154.1 hypothetical protein C426_0427 [Lactococcus garvieae DCC43]